MKEILSISSTQLKRIVALKEKIEKLQSKLQAAVTDSAPAGKAAPKRRRMSAAARKKISAAAKARWAKVKGTAKAASQETHHEPRGPQENRRRRQGALGQGQGREKGQVSGCPADFFRQPAESEAAASISEMFRSQPLPEGCCLAGTTY